MNMANGQTLVEELNVASKLRVLDPYKNLPDHIVNNLNDRFAIREYERIFNATELT